MPNWCLNKVTISGPTADLAKLKDELHSTWGKDKETWFDLSKIDPEPLGPMAEDDQGPHGQTLCFQRYNWRINHWGVKWNVILAEEPDLVKDPDGQETGYLTYVFSTPWNAPFEAYKKLRSKYRSLTYTVCATEPDADMYYTYSADPDGWSEGVRSYASVYLTEEYKIQAWKEEVGSKLTDKTVDWPALLNDADISYWNAALPGETPRLTICTSCDSLEEVLNRHIK